MYGPAIAELARLGVLVHSSLDSMLDNYYAIAKMFEMYIADRLSLARGTPFLLWEDLPRDVKDARGMSRRDTGIDVTDGVLCAVQCKLRHGSLTYSECATFFASAVSLRADPVVLQWNDLIIARNACSTLSRNLAFMRSTPKDMPVPLSEFRAHVTQCLVAHPHTTLAPVELTLRDYQIEAIDLCTQAAQGPVYISLPTGSGKNVIISHSVKRILDERGAAASVIVFAPYVTIADQIKAGFDRLGIAVDYIGDSHPRTMGAQVTVCVYASAHLVDASRFTRVFVDEAHKALRRAPDSEREEPIERVDDARYRSDGYRAVRAAAMLPSACLFSATINIPEHAPHVMLSIRDLIRRRVVCDYQFDVPVFNIAATDASLARHLVQTYVSMMVFANSCAEGRAFTALLNSCAAHGAGIAMFVDHNTPRRELQRIIDLFRAGLLPFIVNVRRLTEGFDAPNTRGVCFLHMPASGTQFIQAVGRALRMHPDKQIASVVLPFVGDADHLAGAKRARDAMRMFAQSDAAFAQSLTRGGDGFVNVTIAGREAREAATEGLQLTAQLLYTEIFDSMGRASRGLFETTIDEYVQYRLDHNGTTPPSTGPYAWLYQWASTQRNAKETMLPTRRAALDAIGFVWTTPATIEWEVSKAAWARYVATHGRLPSRTGPDVALSRWGNAQRTDKRTMSAEHHAALDAIGFSWYPREELWERRRGELAQHLATHHSMPTIGENYTLYQWCHCQLTNHTTMKAERIAKLDAIQGWHRWQEMRRRN